MFEIIQEQKNNLGLVLTPKKTSDYIISSLGEIKDYHKILDPCVGPGVFIESLLKIGVKREQIHAFDINGKYQEYIEKLGVDFSKKDTLLSLFPDSYNQFDFIIGNPPYLNKSSLYVRENRKELKKIYGKINAHETYSMFIVNSIWRMKEGGKLGFITSDSFLTLSTHTKLRRFILNNCIINQILLAPKNLFDKQHVSTSPVIIILTKCTGKDNKERRQKNKMLIIPRVRKEVEYNIPPKIHKIKQYKYHLLPFNIFFTDVEVEILDLFEKSSRLEEYIKGFIGMHTHNNLKYVAAVEDTDLAQIFKNRNKKIMNDENKYRIISKNELNTERWKPYLKRGGADQYYRPIMEALEWGEISIPIYDIPKNVPFEEEGIVISGVSSRLAARYMPKGCYWDSNKAIGFIIKKNSISIEYALGLLNSSLYNYLAKGIINNTNSIQLTGIHSLPFIKPELEFKEKIELLVSSIIKNKEKNLSYDYSKEQKIIDDLIFHFYAEKFKLPIVLKKELDSKYSIYQN
ncbi:MAG: Eco57I restriction-modification methylase domain-containing protein [Promethearchaeota archaeon]